MSTEEFRARTGRRTGSPRRLALGYDEHSYFIRVFRKRHGVTSLELRASGGVVGG